MQGRLTPSSSGGGFNDVNIGWSGPELYQNLITVNGANPVTGITFSYGSAGGHACIFALSGNTNAAGAGAGTNWVPLAVAGYNEDMVVEAGTAQPGNVTNYTTATLDAGTANTGNTYYELGFNRIAPATGLPHAGSTFTSLLHPNRTYMMAPSYQNLAYDAVLISSNVPSADIAPALAAPYTALSILSTGANIGAGIMTNSIIVQHADGTRETNLFQVYDWQSTLAGKAFSASGRFDLNNPGTFNSVSTNEEELYESTIQLANTASPVTNMIVNYYNEPESGSTAYILAISGTDGGLPASILSGPLPASQEWYPSQTATFTVTTFGSAPVTNTWLVESNGLYYPLTDGVDGNGSTISGSHSTTLVISGLTLADGTNYEFMTANSFGSNTSGPALLVINTGTPSQPVISSQTPPSSISTLTVFSNRVTTFSVTTSAGAPPLSYQWYNAFPPSPATAIPNAIGSSYANLDTNNNADIYCVVSNFVGTAQSTPITLNVISPSSYQSALLSYNPVSYWPLNELSGNIAYDYTGNNNGTYEGNFTLGVSGLPPTDGIGYTTAVGFDGATAYVTIPVNNLNITGPLTVSEWLQTGGETQFTTPLGHTDSGYRLDVDAGGLPHFAEGSSPDLIGPTAITDGNWHQLVGTYNGASASLYVDGVLARTLTVNTPAGSTDPVWIGGAPDYGGRFFEGNIAEVAIYTNALTANQVADIYYSLELPPTVSITPANPSVYTSANITLTAVTNGTPPLALQWYYIDTMGNSNAIAGATNGIYTIVDASTNQNGYYFGVLVENDYGTNAAEVPLSVQNGPPYLLPGGDLSILNAETYVGAPTIFTVNASGSEPLFYQWFVNGVAVQGATNATFNAPAACGQSMIQVAITNSYDVGSPIYSSTATIQGDAYPANITFTNGSGWTLNGFPQDLSGNVLELTDGGGAEASSAVYDTPQFVGAFNASFIYQGAADGADGIVFMIESSSEGVNALGSDGGDLGFSGIAPSFGLELNIYDGSPIGIAPATNGNTLASGGGAGYASTGPVAVDSGDPIQFQLGFAGGILSIAMTDILTSATYSTNFVFGPVTNILAGTDFGYVGFTGSDGGVSSVQTITGFEFNSVIPSESLTLTSLTAGSFALSWPAADPDFLLEQSPDLLNWSAGPSPVVVGGVNKVTVTIPAGSGQTFYRLARIVCQ